MNQRLAYITLIVDDYDRAIEFYTKKLNFQLIEDTRISESKRWVLIRPNGEGSCCLLLAKASDENQLKCIGNQTGGRVFLFLFTDNIDRDYNNLLENKIAIAREPRDEPYGKVVVFKDIFGNLWERSITNRIIPDESPLRTLCNNSVPSAVNGFGTWIYGVNNKSEETVFVYLCMIFILHHEP